MKMPSFLIDNCSPSIWWGLPGHISNLPKTSKHTILLQCTGQSVAGLGVLCILLHSNVQQLNPHCVYGLT